jgi:hypothetical protein
MYSRQMICKAFASISFQSGQAGHPTIGSIGDELQWKKGLAGEIF